jgi:hypothetical protein
VRDPTSAGDFYAVDGTSINACTVEKVDQPAANEDVEPVLSKHDIYQILFSQPITARIVCHKPVILNGGEAGVKDPMIAEIGNAAYGTANGCGAYETSKGA